MPTFRFAKVLVVLIAFSLISCSSKYRPLMLQRLSYQDEKSQGDVVFSYAHNIQYHSDNKWYAKKERKFGMIAVAVKVQNNSDEIIELSPVNLKVYGANGEARRLFTPTEYGEKVKQRTGRHLLHSLYGLWINGFFIPIGLGVGIGNAVRASKANRINVANFDQNAIWNRVVEPGEVVYGTVLISGVHGEDLNFVYRY